MDNLTSGFWENVFIGIGGAIIVLMGGLAGMRKYIQQWQDQTTAANVATANVVATDAIQQVTGALRKELEMMAALYQEATKDRSILMAEVRDLRQQVQKLEDQIGKLSGIEEENSQLKAENQMLKGKLTDHERMWANHCLLCTVDVLVTGEVEAKVVPPGASAKAAPTDTAGEA